MQRINKLAPSSVELIEEVEESYQAGLEVFHQLHCLDVLRKSSYPEYYHANKTESSWIQKGMERIHTGISPQPQSFRCNFSIDTWNSRSLHRDAEAETHV